jgi:hypothetical protein
MARLFRRFIEINHSTSYFLSTIPTSIKFIDWTFCLSDTIEKLDLLIEFKDLLYFYMLDSIYPMSFSIFSNRFDLLLE